MNIRAILKVGIRAILLPIIAVWTLSKFNIFNYITFIPEDYKFEFGISCYLVLLESLYGYFELLYESSKAQIICTFYKTEDDKNLSNMPTIRCSDLEIGGGVTFINCELLINGNLKVLKDCKIELNLPKWLSSQANCSDKSLNFEGKTLMWDLSYLLPQNGEKNQTARTVLRIPFIKDKDDSEKQIKLTPSIKKSKHKFLIRFSCNSFTVRS